MKVHNYKDNSALSNTPEAWSSAIAGSVNNNTIHIRAMNSIEANWHVHPDGDEFFLVLEGEVFIDTEQESFLLHEKEFIVVTAGIRHRARCEASAKLLVIDNFNA